jgi:hypothetical protein
MEECNISLGLYFITLLTGYWTQATWRRLAIHAEVKCLNFDENVAENPLFSNSFSPIFFNIGCKVTFSTLMKTTTHAQWTYMKRWLSCHFRVQVLKHSLNGS